MGDKIRKPDLYLNDIKEAIAKVKKYTKNMEYREFRKNSLVVDGVSRNFEIIGEAAGRLPKYVKDKNKNIEWKQVIAFRNIIAHEYFGISYRIMWDIVKNEIPALSGEINKISL